MLVISARKKPIIKYYLQKILKAPLSLAWISALIKITVCVFLGLN